MFERRVVCQLLPCNIYHTFAVGINRNHVPANIKFSASFCERILFLKDGKIFNEIFRGEKSRKDFFNEILDILTLLGGEVGNVR